MNLTILAGDFSQAFLNSKSDRDNIFVALSPGLRDYFGCRYAQVLRGLYGLKQAAMLWNRILFKILREFGLQQSTLVA